MRKPLILWGGVDVDPELYGETPHQQTQHPNKGRDATEIALYQEAVANGTPVIGVCRGSQLICVLNGGKLWQHTQPHSQQHSLMCDDGSFFNSVMAGHHQIMRPRGTHKVLSWNPSPVKCWVDNHESVMIIGTPEVVWFPETKSLAIQPHPEWAGKEDAFVIWINNILKEKEIDYEF